MGNTTAFPEPEPPNRGDTPKRTAFITAPTAALAKSLRKVLDGIGFVSLTTFEADQPGKNISQISTDCMKQSKIVIAVLGEGPMMPNVFFELGLAHGLGKRILIVADEKAVPTAMSLGDPYTRAKPDDTEAIEFAVTQVLALPHHGGQMSGETARQTHPISGLADELLASLRSKENPLREVHLLELVRRAIDRSGVTAVSEAKFEDSDIDLAVWSDDLEPWVHNPVLIELKLNVRTKTEAKKLIELMRRNMKKARVSTSLVIYGEATSSAKDIMHAADILFVSVEDFLESLRTAGFGEVVRRLRNRNVHGAG